MARKRWCVFENSAQTGRKRDKRDAEGYDLKSGAGLVCQRGSDVQGPPDHPWHDRSSSTRPAATPTPTIRLNPVQNSGMISARLPRPSRCACQSSAQAEVEQAGVAHEAPNQGEHAKTFDADALQ